MQAALIEEMEQFVGASLSNIQEDGRSPYFSKPLVGFAAASDALFIEYKRVIGEYHLMPCDVLSSAQTVICWVLPIVDSTRTSNRQETRWPSRAWTHTREFGEALNVQLRQHVVQWLQREGWAAVAPQLSPLWQGVEDPQRGPASNWSERHAAYAAGLGTFSLNDGFITSAGIAHRLGSVVTDLQLEPTHRTAPNHLDHCLWHRKHTCGVCIRRCPVGAISANGHNKFLCREYVYVTLPRKLAGLHGVSLTGCGLCQTGVPCEASIP